MTELTHDQKLQRAAELLTAQPAKLIKQILIRAMTGVVDGSLEAVKEAEAKIDALEAEVARLREALETIAGTTDGTDCNDVARHALKEQP